MIRRPPRSTRTDTLFPDTTLFRSRLVCANDRYEALFGGLPTPPGLPVGDSDVSLLAAAGRAAWRDGSGKVARLVSNGTPLAAAIERAGALEEMLLWRFHGAEGHELAGSVYGLLAGPTGDRSRGPGRQSGREAGRERGSH